jgi:hypothetical protein
MSEAPLPINRWLGEAGLYNLLLPEDVPAASKTFRNAGLSSSASKSLERSGYAVKRKFWHGEVLVVGGDQREREI